MLVDNGYYQTSLTVINVALLTLAAMKSFRAEGQVLEISLLATTPLRVVLAGLVVLSHLHVHPSLNLGLPSVALFFFLSGYGSERSLSQKGPTYLNGYEKKHLVKLLTPLFLASVLWMVVRECLYLAGVTQEGISLSGWLYNMRHGNIEYLLPHCWFVWVLLMFGLSFAQARRSRFGDALMLLITAAYYVLLRFVLQWGVWWWISAWTFLMGVVYAENESRLKDLIRRLTWKYPAFLLVLYLFIRMCIDPFCKGLPLVGELSHSFVCISVVTALYFFRMPTFGWIMAIGGVSFEVYLLHGIVYNTVEKFISNWWCILMMTFVITIALAFPFHGLANRIARMFSCKRMKI